MIVLLPKSFCPKIIVQFLCDSFNDIKKTFDTMLDIRGSKSNILEIQNHPQEYFRHCNFQGCFTVVAIFYFERHTYSYSLNAEHALISPNLENRTIIVRWREYPLNIEVRLRELTKLGTSTLPKEPGKLWMEESTMKKNIRKHKQQLAIPLHGS